MGPAVPYHRQSCWHLLCERVRTCLCPKTVLQVPFEQVPDLVAGRRVYLQVRLLPCTMCNSLPCAEPVVVHCLLQLQRRRQSSWRLATS